MAIQKEIDDPKNRTLRAQLSRAVRTDDGRSTKDIFKAEMHKRTKWMRSEPNFAMFGVPMLAAFSVLPGMFAGEAYIEIGHVNNQTDSVYEYAVTPEEGAGYMGFSVGRNEYAITFNDGQYNLFQESTRRPNEEMHWQNDPGAALDRIRSLRVALNNEVDSLESGRENSDISVVAFERLSPFHQDLDEGTFERNFEGTITPHDGLTYAQRLHAAIHILDEAENYIINSTYGQSAPDVEVQKGMKDMLEIAAVFPALVLFWAFGSAPLGAGISTARQVNPMRRRKTVKPKL